MRRHNLLYLAAAAYSSGTVNAWILPGTTTSATTTPASRAFHTRSHFQPDLLSPQHPFHRKSHYEDRPTRKSTTSRLYSSGKDEGFLAKVGKAVKSFLPQSIFGSDEEKQKLARKKEYRDQVSGGLDQIFKDAPLGIRMMGKMVSPLLSSMASSLADTMAEQQRTTEQLMDDARGYLMGDPAVAKILGEPISLGTPFSQSTATTSINGKSQTRVELGMPVFGSRSSGTVRLLATQDGISQLLLEAAGRSINVSLSRTATSYSGSSGYKVNGDDNIIEAEVIEKKAK